MNNKVYIFLWKIGIGNLPASHVADFMAGAKAHLNENAIEDMLNTQVLNYYLPNPESTRTELEVLEFFLDNTTPMSRRHLDGGSLAVNLDSLKQKISELLKEVT